MSEHRQRTAAHFSRHAEAYRHSPTHAYGDDLELVARLAVAKPGERALDVACGAGHTTVRIAKDGARVTAIDIAPGMIATTLSLAAERGLAERVDAVLAEAAAMPFSEGSFDLVTCRIAPHHFANAPAFLKEVGRVLKPDGRLVLEDSVAPSVPAVAAFLEALEVRRDPTHVHSLTDAEWRAGIAGAGLAIVAEALYEKIHPFAPWLARVGLDDVEAATIEREILTASAQVKAALFEIAEERVVNYSDHKLILHAKKPTA
ncbi:MAG: class I SAM-dependent methyltransferase [Kiloniellales bacterium]